MTTANARQLAAADAAVRTWPSLPAAFRDEVTEQIAETAEVVPQREVSILRLRGVEREFDTVHDAISAAVALGIPLSRVRVGRFPMPPVELAESPGLRSL